MSFKGGTIRIYMYVALLDQWHLSCIHLNPVFTYHADVGAQGSENESEDYAMANKKQVVHFVQEWYRTIGDAFWEDKSIKGFLEVRIYVVAKSKWPKYVICITCIKVEYVLCWYFRKHSLTKCV